jgi:chemotaxis protein MotD
MTVGLTQTSTIATGAQPGGRGARHAGGSGFDEALGSLRHGSGEASAGGHARSASSTPQHRHHHVRDKTVDEASGGEGIDKPVHHAAAGTDEELLAALDAGSQEPSQKQGAEADSGEETGLPTQMRAEQTISVLMAVAPVERRANAAGAATGKPGSAARDAEGLEMAASDKARAGQASSKATGSLPASAAPQAKAALVAAGAAATLKPAGTAGTSQAADATAAGDHAARAATIGKAAHKAEAGEAAEAREAGGSGKAEGQPVEGHSAQATPQTETASKPAQRDADGSGGQSRSDSSAEQDRAPEARRGDPLPASVKVSVVAQQAAPAPAAPQLSANATAIVTTIAAESGWRPSNASSDSLQAFRNAQPMRSLKIELHPAELGTVTANLRTAGEQMSVELQVDNREAYDRLSADSEAIVKSLRSLGYDIDRVSIQQPQAATTGVQRADVSANTGSFSRDASSFQSDNQGSGGERLGGQAGGRDGGNEGQHNGQTHEARQDRAGGGIYI